MKIEFPNSEQNDKLDAVRECVTNFVKVFKPLEKDKIYIMADKITKAYYCECHILADKLIENATVDVPLDPDQQPEYRANRDLVVDDLAFARMKEDALKKRTFSNIVAEFNTGFNEDYPLKIIGGQHRFIAIGEALEQEINEWHGIKVYFNLDTNQRLDVQLISNTNIAVSPDLLDRMLETVKGPELRDWCHKVGLLEEGHDFADKKQRGNRITVRAVRTFIMNYYKGKEVDTEAFDKVRTIPVIAKTGTIDLDWENLRAKKTNMWNDKKLLEAGRQFALLALAQNNYFTNKDKKHTLDYADKALNYAVLASWAFIAGTLSTNKVRLEKHYGLAKTTSRDPLNAEALATARHKTDPENYRGLGSRTDVKERGRLVELFFLQAEKGGGITKPIINLAIKKYHAKLAMLEVFEAERKV